MTFLLLNHSGDQETLHGESGYLCLRNGSVMTRLKFHPPSSVGSSQADLPEVSALYSPLWNGLLTSSSLPFHSLSQSPCPLVLVPMFLPQQCLCWPPTPAPGKMSFLISMFHSTAHSSAVSVSLTILLLSVWFAHCFSPFQHWRLYEGQDYFWLWLLYPLCLGWGWWMHQWTLLSLGNLCHPQRLIYFTY